MKSLLNQLIIFVFLLLLSSNGLAIETMSIKSTKESIKIDGQLNELVWQDILYKNSFTQSEPNAGTESKEQTSISITYDDNAIYIGAILYENHEDSITKTLSQRDDFGNADYFGLVLDTYGSGTLGFGFMVTSSGVQIDELHTINDTDRSWNAVWQSAVKHVDNNWILEIKIPYSAIRFPNVEIQNWQINFMRSTRRKREVSYWNYYDPNKLNLLSQMGQLDGIKNIKSPFRFSLTPYVSSYIEFYDGNQNSTFNGGLDLKYGINDAFTIDMTLIPDFGQVKFDDQILNLSPFEVRFNENRQFFTEGTELFSKGDLFYSRRIGSQPINQNLINDIDSNEIALNSIGAEQLINATKFSGRTKKGLGIGVFNGLTKASRIDIYNTDNHSVRTIETSPLTNYNVLVLDQNLKYNSSITFVNTNVWRSGHTYDANVSAIIFNLFNKSEKYNLFGNTSISQKIKEDETEIGQKYEISIGKVSGKFQTELNAILVDDKFNPNDLGFLSRNNYKSIEHEIEYKNLKPKLPLYKTWSSFTTNYLRLHNPDNYSNIKFNAKIGGLFKNFLASELWLDLYPIDEHDYYEPRQSNKFYARPGGTKIGGFISSNYGKPFALDVATYFLNRFEKGRNELFFRASPRLRLNDKLSLIYVLSYTKWNNDVGLALTSRFQKISIDGNPLFGKRNRENIVNVLTANYIFSNKMDLSLKIRHYWAKVNYSQFYSLAENGLLNNENYSGIENDVSLHNSNYNAFTIDMVYAWVFAPGSQLSFVWKNSLFSNNSFSKSDYIENFDYLKDEPILNSLSLKLLYYIDYNTVKSFKFKN